VSVEEVKIGVYVCHCGKNIAGVIDPRKIAEFASKLPGVVVARDYPYMCSEPGQALIEKDIRELRVNRVVVAACSPRMHEPTFQGVLARAGLNPYLLEMVNLREHVTWVHGDDPEAAEVKAKELVSAGVERVARLEPLETERIEVVQNALVIGGGIAGIRAALNLANAGFKVYLVEREPSIGGKMAKLDKTFPTLDCSQCILTPLMVDVANHSNISLYTYSEVESVEGSPGNFLVKIRLKPTYVDWSKCVGCGICIEKCPSRVPDEFDEGLRQRKAIYIQFPQAVPRKAVIDPDACFYLTKGVCRVCERVCPAGAIDFEQEPRYIELKVGTIIVAVGFDLYNPVKLYEYGYGRYKNVITGLQLERLSSAGGPTGGKIVRPSDRKIPKTVAIVLCAGSRDKAHLEYCCRIGCMAGLKHAYYIKTSIPDAKVFICYTDMRSFGKGYEEFYSRIRSMEDVYFVRGRPMEIFELPDGTLQMDVYDQNSNRMLKIEADLIVLEVGVVPPKGFEELRKKLKIPTSPEGWGLELHPKLKPVEITTDGIYLAGFIQGPKDIPDAVAHGGAAAAAAITFMSKGYIESEPYIAEVNEELCSGCGICVPMCPYDAISIVEREGRRIAKVDITKCKGCGACAGACPSGAMQQRHFKDSQLMPEIVALARGI